MDGAEVRWRRITTSVLAVVVTIALFLGIVASWAAFAVSNSNEFSRRAVAVLDSASARHEIAQEITDELVKNSAELVSYRSILSAVIEDIIDTDAFRTVFRAAVEEAHKILFSNAGQAALLDLSQSVAVISTTLQIINPSVAEKLPPDTANVILDVSDKIQGLHLLQVAEDFTKFGSSMLLVVVGGAIAIIALEARRQRGVMKVGFAVLTAGVGIVALTILTPSIAGSRVADPVLAGAIRDATYRLLGDLRTIGFWIIAVSVIVITLGSAVAPHGEPLRIGALRERAERVWRRWQPTTPAARIVRGLAFVAAALLLIALRDAVLPIAVALAGAYLGYLGLFQVLQVVAPQTRPVRVSHGQVVERVVERSRSTRWLALAAVGLLFFFIASAGFLALTFASHRDAVAAAEIQCNGSTDLCDRTLDQVAFPASHNAMSAADEPGWLFAENLIGIPDQLEYGIRALLMKSHYGRPSGVNIGGAPIVVTDKQAETAVRPQASEDEIGSEAFTRAQQISAAVPQPAVQHQVYLCHVYCELGAVRYVDALTSVKRFLTRNPNEVIILIVGDFVSTDDTNSVFEQVGLADRRWDYDPTQPMPTLRQLIDDRHNIVMMSENSTQPPSWNIGAYQQLVQDTPFTFASPDDFNCNTNRGPADAPLFQINHWITNNSPPNVDQARSVNAYDVLMPRVRQCQQARGKFPTLIGVNFSNQGDLLRVVDEVNGVTTDHS